jgi:hypothetical protein
VARILGEVGHVSLVHLAELGAVGEVDAIGDNVLEAEAGRLQQFPRIRHDRVHLRRQVAFNGDVVLDAA